MQEQLHAQQQESARLLSDAEAEVRRLRKSLEEAVGSKEALRETMAMALAQQQRAAEDAEKRHDVHERRLLAEVDRERLATAHAVAELAKAASFYRACGETLARCIEIDSAANVWPNGRRRNSDRSSIFDGNFDRQVLSPCWTRTFFLDTNADARMVRQIGTLMATAEVVFALDDWRRARLPEARQGPLH
jgi:hypothetical protein